MWWIIRRFENLRERNVRIRIKDDHGQVHEISLPNSVHIPGLPMVLISPQHWDQEADPAKLTTAGGTYVIKCGHHLKYCKTIAHSMSSKTPKLTMASGPVQHQAYSAVINHVCKQAVSKNCAVWCDRCRGRTRRWAQRKFHLVLKTKIKSLPVLTIMMSLEMRILFGDH